jgi:hypothetical protein
MSKYIGLSNHPAEANKFCNYAKSGNVMNLNWEVEGEAPDAAARLCFGNGTNSMPGLMS